jgi:hypothetical protein
MSEGPFDSAEAFFRTAKRLCPCRILSGNQGIRILPRTSTSPRTSIGVRKQTKTSPFGGSEWDQLMDGWMDAVVQVP